MKALILAAGRGARMGRATHYNAKCLLPISQGQVVIDMALAALRNSGVSDVVVVVGHAADRVKAHLSARHPDLHVTYVYNEQYLRWNNWFSLLVGLRQTGVLEPVLLLNSDVVFSPKILQLVQSVVEDAASYLVVDTESGRDPEDMKVKAVGRRIIDIGKDLDPAESAGEYIGVGLLKPRFSAALIEALEHIRRAGDVSQWYEGAFRVLVRSGMELSLLPTNGAWWAEVDTPDDLQRVLKALSCNQVLGIGSLHR